VYVLSSALGLPQPLSRNASECDPPPPPDQRVEGQTARLRLRGWGSPNSDDFVPTLPCLLRAHLSSRNLTTPSTQMNGSDSDWIRWSLGRGGSNGGQREVEGLEQRVLNELSRTAFSPSYDMAPPPSLPPCPISKLSLFLSLTGVAGRASAY
jgi:hypothetical protein